VQIIDEFVTPHGRVCTYVRWRNQIKSWTINQSNCYSFTRLNWSLEQTIICLSI